MLILELVLGKDNADVLTKLCAHILDILYDAYTEGVKLGIAGGESADLSENNPALIHIADQHPVLAQKVLVKAAVALLCNIGIIAPVDSDYRPIRGKYKLTIYGLSITRERRGRNGDAMPHSEPDQWEEKR